MGSTRYILIFTIVMCVLVALLLSGMFYATKPVADQNEKVFNKRAILAAVDAHLETNSKNMSDQQVLDVFNSQVEQVAVNTQGEVVEGVQAENIDMAKERKKPESERILPFFVYNTKDGKKFYIISVRGNGLWDEIWGNVALESDLNTVAGASFDHKAETPGLGAEIKDNPSFAAQFTDTKIYDEEGMFVSVLVRKGGAKDKEHEVDGISGATITSDGVTKMLKNGLELYQPYFEKIRKEEGVNIKG